MFVIKADKGLYLGRGFFRGWFLCKDIEEARKYSDRESAEEEMLCQDIIPVKYLEIIRVPD